MSNARDRKELFFMVLIAGFSLARIDRMSVLTPTMPALTPRLPAVPEDHILRLSVEQYHGMIRGGILTDDDPVELLEGWLVTRMPKNPAHRIATRLLQEALEKLIPQGWYAERQEPITTADSEPEPDVAVIRGDTRQYTEEHPGPQNLALVAEVADTTLRRDR